MNTSMTSPWLMIGLMLFLMVVSATAYIAVRLLGAHAVDSDHPSSRTRHP